MGCCASSTETNEGAAVVKKIANKIPVRSENTNQQNESFKSTEMATDQSSDKNQQPSDPCLTTSSHKKPVPAKYPTTSAFAAPAPGVKNVRPAYEGKGWAPPQREYSSNKKTTGDKTKIEIEDEWDDDGNLKRTTTKVVTTTDWKTKTEKTIELIPAEEAERMGLKRN